MKVKIITDCLDLLADFEILNSKECFQQIIDVLCSYKKPQKKSDNVEATKTDLSVYLLVSNIRNTCKLSILGVLNGCESYAIAQNNCELALSLLVDDIAVIEPEKIQ